MKVLRNVARFHGNTQADQRAFSAAAGLKFTGSTRGLGAFADVVESVAVAVAFRRADPLAIILDFQG